MSRSSEKPSTKSDSRRRRKTYGVDARVRKEIQGMLTLAVAVLLFLSLFHPGMGYLGVAFRHLLLWILGRAAWLIPVLVLSSGLIGLLKIRPSLYLPRVAGLLVGGLALASWFQAGATTEPSFDPEVVARGGGYVGAVVHWVLLGAIGPLGLNILLVVAGLVSVLLILNTPVRGHVLALLQRLQVALSSIGGTLRGRVGERSSENTQKNVDVPDEMGSTGPASDDARPLRIQSYQSERSAQPGLPASTAQPAEEGGASRPSSDVTSGGQKPGASTGEGAAPLPVGMEQMRMDMERLYELPPTHLLTATPVHPAEGGQIRGELSRKARLLESTLKAFGITAKVAEISHGPTVTRFDLRPGPGVKVSQIVSLADDIALSMATSGVRVVAPVPGKSAVGIEVPNSQVSPVSLREILESSAFRQSQSLVSIALGADITGKPLITNLEEMLHMLIAGSTGSGKSICIRCLIASILFKARPDQVKLLLIDPKVVEFMSYNGLPHLLAPVVTDSRKAAGCLTWAVKEMERRYHHFADVGVRDLPSYNLRAVELNEAQMPRIVIIIDELADLMMVARVDVEDAIQRLAQMARAAGIHLIVATQRPSVDVITGVIKANIPSRIAFAVSSSADSRTILDAGGAEKLIGHGDMLYSPIGRDKAIRAQGSFLSDPDLETLLKFLKDQARPHYREDVIEAAEEAHNGGSDISRDDHDPKLEEAVEIVMDAGEASVSMLQRRLRVGYTRAGRLVDTMETMGVVGPYQGSKARELLMTRSEYQSRRNNAAGDESETDSDVESPDAPWKGGA